MDSKSLKALSKFRYISMAGLIGVGKTTLAIKIAEALGAGVYHENIDQNAYVPRYFKDEHVAFPMQVRFISDRLTQNLDIRAFLEKSKANKAVQDRTIYEDAFVFGYHQWRIGKLTQWEYNQCIQIYKAGMMACVKPGAVLYLKADISTLLKRIGVRGRGYEAGIDAYFLEYLEKIYEKNFLREMAQAKVNIIHVDMNGKNPVFHI